MIQNSKGLSLIELLAAVSLSAIILLLVYQFLFQGFQFSKVVNDKTLLQQEANYIVATMTKIHQTSDFYMVMFDQNPNATYITLKGKSTITFQNDHFLYELKTGTSNNSLRS
jgi:prepilin-type N-terminal cleavage/methylation domain-containing protein